MAHSPLRSLRLRVRSFVGFNAASREITFARSPRLSVRSLSGVACDRPWRSGARRVERGAQRVVAGADGRELLREPLTIGGACAGMAIRMVASRQQPECGAQLAGGEVSANPCPQLVECFKRAQLCCRQATRAPLGRRRREGRADAVKLQPRRSRCSGVNLRDNSWARGLTQVASSRIRRAQRRLSWFNAAACRCERTARDAGGVSGRHDPRHVRTLNVEPCRLRHCVQVIQRSVNNRSRRGAAPHRLFRHGRVPCARQRIVQDVRESDTGGHDAGIGRTRPV